MKSQIEQSKKTHTPTPWFIDCIREGKGTIPELCTLSAGEHTIAPTVDLRDAGFILRAVNAHDELLELSKDVLNWLTVHLELGHINAGTGNRDGDLVSQLRAAISKAEDR